MENQHTAPQSEQEQGKKDPAASITETEAKEQEGNLGGATNLSLDELKQEGGTAGTPGSNEPDDDQQTK